jgi:hypothetical protein
MTVQRLATDRQQPDSASTRTVCAPGGERMRKAVRGGASSRCLQRFDCATARRGLLGDVVLLEVDTEDVHQYKVRQYHPSQLLQDV